MKYFVTQNVIRYIARKLDGYKSIIGGVGSILLGLAGMIGIFYPDSGLLQMEFDVACGYIVGGFAVLGVGGKLEKIARKSNEPV